MRACRLALWFAPYVASSQATRSIVVLPEFRGDLTLGSASTGQVGVGVHARTGTYARFAALAGIGSTWRDGEQGLSMRLELQGRFHLDPFRESRFGLYGIGGVAAVHDEFRDWQSRLVLGAGAELPAYGRSTVALEAALAGGVRLSLVVRRLALNRR